MTKSTTTKQTSLSRRGFFVGAAAAGGGLSLGLKLPEGIGSALAQGNGEVPEVNLWVVVRPDDTCVIRIARSEMGQGTHTGLAQLVAEELECDWKKVRLEAVTAHQNLARKRAWGDMSTGGSRGIRGSQDYVRRGGAAARMMLMQAAANQWKVPVGELSVASGVITHAATKRTISYGKVAAAAAKLPAPDPKTVQLKDPKTWKVAGQPLKRLDTTPKLNGFPTIFDRPETAGNVVCCDDGEPGIRRQARELRRLRRLLDRRGIKKVVRIGDIGVAVVADTWWRAKTALEVLPIKWDDGQNATESDATIAERLKDGLGTSNAYANRNTGDFAKTHAAAPKKVDAVYGTPFLAHATMEPMNATVRWTADKAEAWVPSQNAKSSLAALSEASGLPLDKCAVHNHTLGGGFGRRGAQDFVRHAVAVAKQMPGVPIKMLWSREEDMAHDFYRPISQAQNVSRSSMPPAISSR